MTPPLPSGRLRLILLAGCYAVLLNLLTAGVPGFDEQGSGQPVVLENAWLRLEIDAPKGGRVVRLVEKKGGSDLVKKTPNLVYGLLIDLFTDEGWPGELFNTPYRVVNRRADQVVLEYEVKGDWNHTHYANLHGLLLQKEIALAPDAPLIDTTIRIRNPTRESKSFKYWAQQIPSLGDEPAGDVYWRPSLRGVSQAAYPGTPADRESIPDPPAGWSAAIDRQHGLGLLFAMDYNYLASLNNSLGAPTVEWMYDFVLLPPGETFATAYVTRLFYDLDHIGGASPNVLLSARLLCGKTGWRACLDLQAMRQRLHNGLVEIEAYDPKFMKSIARKAEPLPCLDTTRLTRVEVPLPGFSADPGVLLLKILLKTTAGQERFELPVSSAGPTVLPDDARAHLDKPRKAKVFHKPKDLLFHHNKSPRLLFVKGLFADLVGVERAAAELGAEVKSSYLTLDFFGATVSWLPATHAELYAFDGVALIDIPAGAIPDAIQAMLRDYVEAGGSLLVIGGPLSFGKGGYAGSIIEDLLPVRSGGPFTLTLSETPQPISFNEAGLSGWSPPERNDMAIRSYHVVTQKAASHSLLSVPSSPLLTCWRKGQGWVFCFSGTTLGEYRHGPPYYATQAWRSLMRHIIRRIAGVVKKET